MNQFDPGGISPLESSIGIYFDDWLNQQIMIKAGRTPEQLISSPLDTISPYSNVGTYMRGSQVTFDNEAKRDSSGSIIDTEIITLTRQFCTQFLNLGNQLDFIDRMWERGPSDRQREALRNWATGVTSIQEAASAEIITEDVRSLDTIFDAIPETTVPIVTYRVFTRGYNPAWFADGRYTESAEHRRFMSVSLSKTAIYGHNGRFMETVDPEHSYFVKIIIPPGTKIIPIFNFTKWARIENYGYGATSSLTGLISTQFEIILPRHSNIYNVPDSVSICSRSCLSIHTCINPHYRRVFRFKGTMILVPKVLASILERTFFSSRITSFRQRIPIPLRIERRQFGYPDLVFSISDTFTEGIFDILMEWSFTNARGVRTNGRYIIEVRNQAIVADQEVVSGDPHITVPNEETALTHRVIPLSNTYELRPNTLYTELPVVNDLFVILPRPESIPPATQVLSLQNGWYILYNNQPGTGVHVQLYCPLIYNGRGIRYLLPYSNIPFQGGGSNLIHIDDIGFNNDLTLVEKFALMIPIFGTRRK